MFLLESRLDNLVYRMGLARTRRGARQSLSQPPSRFHGLMYRKEENDVFYKYRYT